MIRHRRRGKARRSVDRIDGDMPRFSLKTSRLAFLSSRADAAFMQFKVGADGALGRQTCST
jgi:hypothetical protein